MSAYRSITGACHALLQTSLRPGDRALDATAGNGGDTLVLAECVGPDGHVWAVDRQPAALRATQGGLEARGHADRCTLLLGNHAEIETVVPPAGQRDLAAVVFNLGYLPGGDKSITTATQSTLHALNQTWSWLRPGGRLAVVCYPGHATGATESIAVREWFQNHAVETGQSPDLIEAGPTERPAPFLLGLRKAIAQ